MKSLNYVKSIETVDENVVKVIMHFRKSLLFDHDNVWVKKENPNFDVTMRSYDGAESCELTGLYMLNVLSSKFGKEKIGLYRDDGLTCFQNMTGSQAERVNKKICEIFQSCGLKISIETNLKITDFLDVTFNLKNENCNPFRKPNNDLLYINPLSNHSKNIIKEIPYMIGKRISEISCDQHEFEKAKGEYKALEKSGFSEKNKYHKQGFVKCVRTRKVIWFNPPYSSYVKKNAGKVFMKLIVKHFSKHHRYHKIFNKNTIKLSYSCMQNMGNIITKHNNKLLFQSVQQPT